RAPPSPPLSSGDIFILVTHSSRRSNSSSCSNRSSTRSSNSSSNRSSSNSSRMRRKRFRFLHRRIGVVGRLPRHHPACSYYYYPPSLDSAGLPPPGLVGQG